MSENTEHMTPPQEAYWESRCRLATETLQLCIDRSDGRAHLTQEAFYALVRKILATIGPLPPH